MTPDEVGITLSIEGTFDFASVIRQFFPAPVLPVELLGLGLFGKDGNCSAIAHARSAGDLHGNNKLNALSLDGETGDGLQASWEAFRNSP
jgi:hypothetical protein